MGAGIVLGIGAVAGGVWWRMDAARMPGASFDGPPPPATAEERALGARLSEDVERLASEIGERHERRYGALLEARDFVEARLREAGLEPRRQSYEIVRLPFDNVYADIGDLRLGYVLVGAHYDSALGSPGGNDNASGVAVLLALADRLAGREDLPRPIRFVAFVNEEPPYFGRETMGSRVFATRLASEGALPEAAIVLDSVGCYRREPHSQRFATAAQSLRFGDVGDFVGFVGDSMSEPWLRTVVGRFRDSARIHSEGAVMRRSSFAASWSDHASFWRHDVPAVLVTDTATFRDERYHTAEDDGSQIDPVALARVVLGLEGVLTAR